MGALIRHGGTIVPLEHAVYFPTGQENFHDVLTLPLTIVAGHPEQLGFRIYGYRLADSGDSSAGTGAIGFDGVPAGARIVSCQGYGSGVTPTRATSWGRLKAIYR